MKRQMWSESSRGREWSARTVLSGGGGWILLWMGMRMGEVLCLRIYDAWSSLLSWENWRWLNYAVLILNPDLVDWRLDMEEGRIGRSLA